MLPLSVSAAMCLATIIGVWIMRWMLIRANRKIRATDSEAILFFAY